MVLPAQPEATGPIVVVKVFYDARAVAILAVSLLQARADKARQSLAEGVINLPEDGQCLGIDVTGKGLWQIGISPAQVFRYFAKIGADHPLSAIDLRRLQSPLKAVH